MMFLRSKFSPTEAMFTPLIKICPPVCFPLISSVSSSSRILFNARTKVDFPEPVRPTTPIFSIELILKSSPLRTRGVFFLYLQIMLLPTISLFHGHFLLLISSSDWRNYFLSTSSLPGFPISRILSVEVISCATKFIENKVNYTQSVIAVIQVKPRDKFVEEEELPSYPNPLVFARTTAIAVAVIATTPITISTFTKK